MTHTLTQLGRVSERGSVGTSERDQLSEIIFMFSGFAFATGAHSISKEVAQGISMDFITGLPKVQGRDYLYVVVD